MLSGLLLTGVFPLLSPMMLLALPQHMGGLTAFDWFSLGLLWLSLVVFFFLSPANSGGFMIMGLITIIVLYFFSNNLIFFYVFFEVALLPIMLLILGWGYQYERLMSTSYMLIYTLSFSLPLMLSLIFLFFGKSSSSLFASGGGLIGGLLAFPLILAFLVKVPIFTLHLWLPKAHVEAPTNGSVVLAALLLKLGGYGVYRLLLLCHFSFFGLLAAAGGVLGGYLCFLQSDGKSVVAYSSIAHMNMSLAPMVLLSALGKGGAAFLMLAHGVISGGLFFMFGLVSASTGTRMVALLTPVGVSMFASCLILLSFGNFGVPPFLSATSEIFSMGGVFLAAGGVAVVLCLYIVVVGYYTLFLLSSLVCGKTGSAVNAPPVPIMSMALVSFPMFFVFGILFL